MTTELTKAAQQALEAFDAFADADDLPTCFELTKKMNELRRALTQRPAAQAEREAFEAWFDDYYDKACAEFGGIDCTDPKGIAEDAWQARASLPAPQQATPEPVFVIEVRECPDCGHIGINEWHPTDSACSHCDWTGPSPQEDKCPGCGTVGSMSSACPECGHKDTLIAHKHLPIPAATPPQQAAQATPEPVGEVVYQIKGDSFECPHAWRDATEEAFYTTPAADRRILYTHPAPGVPEGFALLDGIVSKGGLHGVDLQYRRLGSCGWPKAWRATLISTPAIAKSPSVGFGDTPQEALAAAQAKGGEHE